MLRGGVHGVSFLITFCRTMQLVSFSLDCFCCCEGVVIAANFSLVE